MNGLHRLGRRVVVTGLGCVTPLGCGTDLVWQRLLEGKCGVVKIKEDGYQNLPCKIAAFVPRGADAGQLQVEKHVKKSEVRQLSTATVFALVAAAEAVEDSKLELLLSYGFNENMGVAVGMGMVDLEEVVDTGAVLRKKGYNRVTPYFVTKILNNIPAGHISIRYKLRGPNHCVSTACTTGLHAVGDAMRFIQHGDADAMICGGTESCIGPLSIASFCRIRALATSFNDEPQKASRPFDGRREGFVMGEGAGVLVLEELEHALRRGARIHAEILGYGLSGDAHHVTAPEHEGRGAYLCMEKALGKNRIEKSDVGYINAHATSTPIGDSIESKAIQRLFGECSEGLAVSSTKGATGHLLGAAGAVEAIFTVMACKTGMLPPTLNVERLEDGMSMNHVPNRAQKWPEGHNGGRRIALTNSFGFGGTNASLCVSNWVNSLT